jgi:uncharacterized protein (TIGR02001 family)
MIKSLRFALAVGFGATLLHGQAVTPAASTPSASASAPAAAASSGPTWILTPAFVSNYMYRGTKVAGFALQPNIEVDVGNAMIGVWSNFPLTDKIAGVSDPEIDPYFTYKIAVNDALTLLPGCAIYGYPRAEESNGFYKMTFEPYISASYVVGSVTLAPKLYYDTVLKGATWEFTVTTSVPLPELGSSLDFTATAGTFLWRDWVNDSGPRTKNWGDYYLVGVSMPFEITKTAKVSLGFAYTKGSNNFIKVGSAPKTANSAAVGRAVATLSSTFTF